MFHHLTMSRSIHSLTPLPEGLTEIHCSSTLRDVLMCFTMAVTKALTIDLALIHHTMSVCFRLRSSRNIAEELDPTFKSKKETHNDVFAVCSQEFPVSAQTVPVDGFYDFMDDSVEPIFIPPTKRQPEKLGRSKPKDKKESCKQQ
ncbi:hypothetical protein FKM82_013596 [Ascaphus truei]